MAVNQGNHQSDYSVDAARASVATLREFYSTIVALALAGGLEKLVSSLENLSEGASGGALIALSVAFLSTIVPFYHGMNRHLFDAHIAKIGVGEGGRAVPLLLDIFVFVLEGGLLFAMGRSIDNSPRFFVFWSMLLVLDIVWALAIWRIQKSDFPRWARNSGFWVVLVGATWWGLPIVAAFLGFDPIAVASVIVYFVVPMEVARSTTDYIANWNFYFPTSKG